MKAPGRFTTRWAYKYERRTSLACARQANPKAQVLAEGPAINLGTKPLDGWAVVTREGVFFTPRHSSGSGFALSSLDSAEAWESDRGFPSVTLTHCNGTQYTFGFLPRDRKVRDVLVAAVDDAAVASLGAFLESEARKREVDEQRENKRRRAQTEADKRADEEWLRNIERSNAEDRARRGVL